eukprot:gene9982-7862_t
MPSAKYDAEVLYHLPNMKPEAAALIFFAKYDAEVLYHLPTMKPEAAASIFL